MRDPCSVLEWDSAFWGVPIGRVEPRRLDADTLGRVEAWSAEKRVRCLYLLADSDDPATIRLAEQTGFRLVDVRVELAARLEGGRARGRPVGGVSLRASEPADLDALKAIARTSHEATRFYADPNFPDPRCDDFYEIWIERSCDGWADAVLVADQCGAAVGYVTCHVRGGENRGSIGLIAVAGTHRGRGVGGLLVDGALAWLADRGLKCATVVTQGRNVAAQRAFQRGGFRPADVAIWFHRWFDEW